MSAYLISNSHTKSISYAQSENYLSENIVSINLSPNNNEDLTEYVEPVAQVVDVCDNEIVKKIVEYGNRDIRKCIKLLKNSYVVMKSGGREKLLIKDVELAGKLGRG